VQYSQEELEDTKGVIRIRISKKNRQHNGQKVGKPNISYSFEASKSNGLNKIS